MKKFIFLITLILLLLCLLVGCNTTKQYTVFGTFLEIKISGSNGAKITNEIFNTLDGYENILSPTIEGSDLYKINHADAEQPIVCSDITIQLAEISLEVYNLSNHAYNPAVYPIVELWGFDANSFVVAGVTKTPPTDAQINALLPLTDYANLFTIDSQNKTITKHNKDAKIDFGGIAKGYSIGAMKEKIGSRKTLIDLGGNIISFNNSYTIGINSPRKSSSSLFGKFTLNDNYSVSTSGDYQRYFEYEGKKYHHIIDPSTGHPTDNGIIAVTIVTTANDKFTNPNFAAYGDALSTAVMVLGKEQGKALVNLLGVSAIIIYQDLTYETIGNINFSKM